MPTPLKSWSRHHLPRALERPHLLWNKAQEWIHFATPSPNLPSSSSPYLCPSGRGGCPRVGCWAGALSTHTRLTGSPGRYRDSEQESRTHSPHSEEAAEKVGVGVSQPRRRRRKKEVGELRRIIPSCQLSVSRRGREEANWFVAQNSQWGIESWKMTAGKLLRNQAHLHLPPGFDRGIN